MNDWLTLRAMLEAYSDFTAPIILNNEVARALVSLTLGHAHSVTDFSGPWDAQGSSRLPSGDHECSFA